MNLEMQKLCASVRLILSSTERCSMHEKGSADSEDKYSSSFLAHAIGIATKMMWNFLTEVEKKHKLAELGSMPGDVPVFMIMNEMLFNQRKFREAITRIIDLHYHLKAKAHNIQLDSRKTQHVTSLTRLIEVLASHTKRARHDDLSEDEAFSNTIALMKVNRILQLREFSESEQDAYLDYSIEQTSGGNANNITESRAASAKCREVEQSNAETLTKLRHIRTNITKWRSTLQDFDRKFQSHLESRLEFALCWNRALATKHFGYAVECYVSKCNKELSETSHSGCTLKRISDKLQIAEKMLMELEEKSVTLSRSLPQDAGSLTKHIEEVLPLLVAMCADVSKAMYSSLVGEIHLKKYEEIRKLFEQSANQKNQKNQNNQHNQNNKNSRAAEDLIPKRSVHRSQKRTKIAQMFKLNPNSGSHSRANSDPPAKAKPRCVHQDIVTEYEASFSQTLAMLEMNEFAYAVIT